MGGASWSAHQRLETNRPADAGRVEEVRRDAHRREVAARARAQVHDERRGGLAVQVGEGGLDDGDGPVGDEHLARQHADVALALERHAGAGRTGGGRRPHRGAREPEVRERQGLGGGLELRDGLQVVLGPRHAVVEVGPERRPRRVVEGAGVVEPLADDGLGAGGDRRVVVEGERAGPGLGLDGGDDLARPRPPQRAPEPPVGEGRREGERPVGRRPPAGP